MYAETPVRSALSFFASGYPLRWNCRSRIARVRIFRGTRGVAVACSCLFVLSLGCVCVSTWTPSSDVARCSFFFFPGDLRVWDCGRDVWPPAQTLFLAFVPAAPAASPLFYVYLFIAGRPLTLLGAVAAVVYINNPVSGCFSFLSFCFSCSSVGRSFSVLPRRGSVSF